MIPVRYSIEWVSAEDDMEDARILFGSIEDWIERGGGLVQGGLVQRMPDEDVVADSPLDMQLRGVSNQDRDPATSPLERWQKTLPGTPPPPDVTPEGSN